MTVSNDAITLLILLIHKDKDHNVAAFIVKHIDEHPLTDLELLVLSISLPFEQCTLVI